MADNLTIEQRRFTMSRIRGRDTKVELLVRRALHAKGFRYRVNMSALPGKPDIVFTRLRLVVFVDGDFWHGWNFSDWREKLAPYWVGKIAGNIQRDVMQAQRLTQEGWTVVRIWEHEVKADLPACIAKLEQIIGSLRNS